MENWNFDLDQGLVELTRARRLELVSWFALHVLVFQIGMPCPVLTYIKLLAIFFPKFLEA